MDVNKFNPHLVEFFPTHKRGLSGLSTCISLHKVYTCCGSILSQFYFPLFLSIVMYDNEFETKENKIWTKDKIEPQHIY